MCQPVLFVFAPHFRNFSSMFDGVEEAFRETTINKQFIHLLHHIIQVMVDRRKVQREEAVPKGESGQAGYSFPLQSWFSGNTENNFSIARSQDPFYVIHRTQVVITKVVRRLGGIKKEEVKSDRVTKVCLSLHHTADDTTENPNTCCFLCC